LSHRSPLWKIPVLNVLRLPATVSCYCVCAEAILTNRNRSVHELKMMTQGAANRSPGKSVAS
jgi:hypothetical protein